MSLLILPTQPTTSLSHSLVWSESAAINYLGDRKTYEPRICMNLSLTYKCQDKEVMSCGLGVSPLSFRSRIWHDRSRSYVAVPRCLAFKSWDFVLFLGVAGSNPELGAVNYKFEWKNDDRMFLLYANMGRSRQDYMSRKARFGVQVDGLLRPNVQVNMYYCYYSRVTGLSKCRSCTIYNIDQYWSILCKYN